MTHATIPQSNRELNVLINFSQKIIRTLDLQQVLQVISDGMSELLEIETAAIYLLENDKELLLGATTPPLPPGMPNELLRASLEDHPNIKTVIKGRKSKVIADTSNAKLTKAEKNIVEIRRLRSLLFLPFVQEEDVLGVLILGTCNKSRKYTKHEVSLGQTIANQFSVAILNSKLHDDLKKHKENLEMLVQEKTNDLNAAIEELKATNDELFYKNEIINNQNIELKATLQHLKETQSHLLQSEKMASLGILTAGVAHEINNPLNFIMGAYIGLEKQFSNYNIDDQNVFVLLNSIKTGVERISTIVSSLNHFSQSNTCNNEQCHINSILDNCLIILSNQISEGVIIHREYAENPIPIKGNMANLHHAFLNILSNSLQAIEQKGIITIKTLINSTKNRLIIEISDTGKGISKENIGKVTEPFFTTKDPGKGIGLGLSITYKIIKDHQGILEFDSVIDKGTSVRVELPAN